jgi:hypothetical protein
LQVLEFIREDELVEVDPQADLAGEPAEVEGAGA